MADSVECLVLSCAGDVKLTVATNSALADSLCGIDFVRQYIPHGQIQRTTKATADIEIFVTSTTTITQHFSPTLPTSLDFAAPLSPEGVVVLVDYYLERKRQELGIYSLHGAAVNKGQKAIVLFGGISGLGKTGTALELSAKHGFELTADERLLISDAGFIGGCDILAFNKESQFALNPESAGIQELKRTPNPIPIGACVLPIVINNDSLEIDKWSPSKASFHLYEELTRKIRGTSKRFTKDAIPVQSFDEQATALKRSSFCELFAEQVPVVLLKGDIHSICSYIESEYFA